MISPDTFFTPTEPKTKRRQALASVYEFLLKLAEEEKAKGEVQQQALEQENNSEPLQENIPS